MSGVLDRMVQRLRGELPAVEPLVSPQRTAAAARPGLAEEIVEREAPASTLEPPKGSSPALHPGWRAVEALEDHTQLHFTEHAAAEESPRSPESLPVRRGSKAPERRRKLIRDREMMEIEAVEAPIASPLDREAAAPGAEAHKPDLAATEIRGTAPPKRSEIELETKPASLRLTEHTEPHGTEPVPPAPHAAAPGIPAAAPVIETGERTEIHITIGSIELRAPRTEAKATPFRPSVTLDEFLKRRPGAES